MSLRWSRELNRGCLAMLATLRTTVSMSPWSSADRLTAPTTTNTDSGASGELRRDKVWVRGKALPEPPCPPSGGRGWDRVPDDALVPRAYA